MSILTLLRKCKYNMPKSIGFVFLPNAIKSSLAPNWFPFLDSYNKCYCWHATLFRPLGRGRECDHRRRQLPAYWSDSGYVRNRWHHLWMWLTRASTSLDDSRFTSLTWYRWLWRVMAWFVVSAAIWWEGKRNILIRHTILGFVENISEEITNFFKDLSSKDSRSIDKFKSFI